MSGSSDVEIANRALSLLGAGPPITSLDDTDDNNAVLAKRELTAAKKETQQQGRFWWTIRRVKLSALSAAPIHTFARAFPLPADFLRLEEIAGEPPSTTYHRMEMVVDENGNDQLCIVTDSAAPLSITYAGFISVSGYFDPLYETALVNRLAMAMSTDITSSRVSQADLRQAYRDALDEAEAAAGSNIASDDSFESPWVAGRLGY